MKSPVLGIFSLIGITALGLFLSYEIATRTFVIALLEKKPEFAATLSPHDAGVLTSSAAAAVEQMRKRALSEPTEQTASAPSRDEIRANVVTALKAEPYNPTALRVLGQLEAEAGDIARARRLMTQATRLSRHETPALIWLFGRAALDGDYAVAANLGDALLATRSLAREIGPTLARIAETPEGKSEIKRLLALNPRWRRDFFDVLPSGVRDPATPLELLQSLSSTAHPATAAEFAPYVRHLIDTGQFDRAYYAWLQSLPPDAMAHAGSIFNGSFSGALTGGPFDWSLRPGSGVRVDITTVPDGSGTKALSLEMIPLISDRVGTPPCERTLTV